MSAQAAARPEVAAGPPPAPEVSDNYKWIAAMVVMVGAVMTILDQTIVNVALSSLQGDFKVSITDIQWVVTGYTLGLAAVIPMTGWMADRFGTKRVFVTSQVAFVVTSVLCGLSVSNGMLIAVRVIQGLAGGLTMPVGMTILMSSSRPEERGRMMAALGVPTLLAPILGPTLGGWLIQSVSWRLIFFVNLPIGAIGVLLGILLLRGRAGRRNVEPIDWVGLLLASPAVVGIVYGLAQPATYGWGSAQTLLPVVAGVVLLAIFVGYELRHPSPLIQIRIFRDGAFTAAVLMSLVIVISLFGSVLLMPLFLQQVQGYGALDTGIIVGAQGAGALLTMPLAGLLTDRLGASRVVPVGLALLFAGTVWSTTLAVDTTRTTIMAMLVVRGMGMGFCMMPVFSAGFVRLRPDMIARATSISNTIQRVSSALGVAVMTTILSSRITAHLPHLPADAPRPGGAPVPPAIRHLLLTQVAKGYDDTFWIAAGLVLLGFPAALFLRQAMRPDDVRSYGLGQLGRGIILGAAARWVERRRSANGGDGAGLSVEPAAGRLLADAADRRLQEGMTILRLGTNAAGLVPHPPVPRWLPVVAGLVLLAALAGLALCFAQGLQGATPLVLPTPPAFPR